MTVSGQNLVTLGSDTRVCKACGETKPLEEFHLNGRDGERRPRCRACLSERRKELRRARPKILPPDSPDWPKCACGCGEPAPVIQDNNPSLGDVRGEPRTYILGHHAGLLDLTTYVEPGTGCHKFVNNPRPGLYRWFRYEGVVVQAHRFLWKWVHGSLRRDQHLHHVCRNKDCVNLDHLVVLSAAEHTRLHTLERYANGQMPEPWNKGKRLAT